MADDSRWRPGKPLRIIPIGDVATASEWIPFARRKMVELSRSGDYARRTWMPAPGVVIRGETLRDIPRVFIEVEGYEYITVSWYNQELHAGDFGLENTSKKILDFPFRAPDGLTLIGPNLLHIGGNQFATGPLRDHPAEQVAIISMQGKTASVKYLPRWRSAEEDRYSIVTLQYGGKTVEGVKRIEYLSNHNIDTTAYFGQSNVSSLLQPSVTGSVAYSSTTPLGSSLTISGAEALEAEALVNTIPFSPVNNSVYQPWHDSSLFPQRVWWFQWNHRVALDLDITATVEIDTVGEDTLYTTVFNIAFTENVLTVTDTYALSVSLGAATPLPPTMTAEAAAANTPGLLDYILSDTNYPQPFWEEDWIAGGMLGGPPSHSKAAIVAVPGTGPEYGVLSAATVQSVATTTLGANKIAILVLTSIAGARTSHNGQAAIWASHTGYGVGGPYTVNMVTITSGDNGLTWHAAISRREVEMDFSEFGQGVYPLTVGGIVQPNTVQFFNTLLYIGGDTVLAFGQTNAGGTVYHSLDAGVTYSLLVPPGGIPAVPSAGMAICLAPGVAGFFSAGKFYRSIDSGATWTTYTIPSAVMTAPWNSFEARIEIRAIGETYETTKLAIVVSTSNTPNTSKIFLSDDGGATWRIDSTIGKKPYPQAQAIGINIGALNTGLPPTPGLPGIYDIPES